MKTHLKYIEGTSDKFWQIETNGMSFSVTYGKNGTSGTSQTKTFGTEDECLKMAEKLVAEKKKKGYSESGEVINAGTPKEKSAKKGSFEEVAERFDALIKNENIEDLKDFLENETKGAKTEFKKHLNKCKRYWMTYVDLSKEPGFVKKKNDYHWGYRSSNVQQNIIKLAAIALLDKSEIKSWTDELFVLIENKNDNNLVNEYLLHFRPNWLADMFLELVREKNGWRIISYHHLIFFEENGLLAFNPELFAHSLSAFTNSSHALANKYKINCLDYILTHPNTHGRDVIELFHYETNIANMRDWGNSNADVNRHWHSFFRILVEKGLLKRELVLQKSFEIQTKEWNNGIKSFFKTLIELLSPSEEEMIAHQNVIFPMLQNSTHTIVGFGIDCCKKMLGGKGFDINAFLEWIAPALYRADIKSGMKSVLMMFDKICKAENIHINHVLMLAADVFSIPQLELQERATKLIKQYGNTDNTELVEKLTLSQPQMQGNVKDILKDFLDGSFTISSENNYEAESYKYKPFLMEALVDEVRIPENWNDLLFSFGSFIASEDVIEAEILWNAFCTQRSLFPENYTEQLQPYLKQLQKNHYGDQIHCSCYKCVTEHYTIQKIHNLQKEFIYKKAQWSSKLKTFNVSYDLLKKIDKKIASGSSLPLLSFPTHLPHFVAPQTLLERVIAYQQTGEEIDKTDLSIAISRMPREKVESAIPLLDKIKGELKPLLAFCLGVSDKILPDGVPVSTQIIQNLKNVLGTSEKTVGSDMLSVWAVAARTYYPEKTFEEFEKTYLSAIPYVVRPFLPEINFKERWNEYTDWQTKQKIRTPSWWELIVKQPDFKKIPENLLYSLDAFNSTLTD